VAPSGKRARNNTKSKKGMLDGGKLSFEFVAPEEEEASGKRLYTMRLNVISDTQIQGEFDFVTNGAKVTGKVMFARAR
jgi:hypothetical protein